MFGPLEIYSRLKMGLEYLYRQSYNVDLHCIDAISLLRDSIGKVSHFRTKCDQIMEQISGLIFSDGDADYIVLGNSSPTLINATFASFLFQCGSDGGRLVRGLQTCIRKNAVLSHFPQSDKPEGLVANGRILCALLDAYDRTQSEEYLQSAKRVAGFVLNRSPQMDKHNILGLIRLNIIEESDRYSRYINQIMQSIEKLSIGVTTSLVAAIMQECLSVVDSMSPSILEHQLAMQVTPQQPHGLDSSFVGCFIHNKNQQTTRIDYTTRNVSALSLAFRRCS